MAFSCVKVSFEIGHEASLRNKRTLEGFTHDWQVFVRGADNTDISQFVDRVIFYLHETFPKPKRIIRSPPYSVKESGYAGFELSIDVYFKTQDAEPKKVRFNYDLTLQPSGPPISKVIREKFVFPNPPEDLRRRLIKGGGVGVTGSGSEVGRFTSSPDKTPAAPSDSVPSLKPPPPLVGKPKLGGEGGKKQKIKEHKLSEDPPRGNDQFADLFGPPIHKTKVSPDPEIKKPVTLSSKSVEKLSNDKHSSKSSKHIPQKEVKQIGSSKEDAKEHSKDREKGKDKSKQSSTSPKRALSPKRPSTPPTKQSITPSKRPSSPHKRPVTPTKLKEEVKKSSEDIKSKTDGKSSDGKSEKKKKDKKSKDDKSKKSKVKGHEKKSSEIEKTEKSREFKDKEKKPAKEIVTKESEKLKTKHTDSDKEKHKHKNKKKDRNKEEDGSKERSKDKVKTSKKIVDKVDKVNEVKENDKNGVSKESRHTSGANLTPSKKRTHSDSPSPVRLSTSPLKQSLPTADKPSSSKDKPHPLKRLLEELTDHESSDSNNSPLSEEDSFDQPSTKPTDKFSQSSAAKTIESIENVVNSYDHSPSNNKTAISKPKEPNVHSPTNRNGKQKDKSEPKKSKDKKKPVVKGETKKEGNGEKDIKKRKRSSSERANSGELPEKIMKKSVDSTTADDPVLVIKESEPVAMEIDTLLEVKDAGTVGQAKEAGTPVDERFTADYVAQLKELQQKIMTLEDNDELQRVVQVIAETGQYEITKKTFDFDLCALDQRTVKRLQDFFIAS